MSEFKKVVIAERKTPLLLVIDDDSVIRTMLMKALQKQGFDVIEAPNGAEGIDLFKQYQPDMVLMDALMPVMNGYEACLVLRKIDPERMVPIMMMTGLNDV